jgi:hypothetical protein
VDLLRYKASRLQPTLDFEQRPAPKLGLAPVRPFRQLTAREVEHRARMMRHLSGNF